MHNTIKKLADIIASHTLEEIQRELRIIALTRKNPNNAQGQAATEEQKKVLLLAQNFITQKGKQAENWRTSTACFEALTDWFEQATHIENHLSLSMISWFCQLEQMLPNSINPNRIITFGSAYYAEPHKFMGFLYWLLEKEVEQKLIIKSNILHYFFAYHAFEMTVLEKSYALLANLSNRTNAFLLCLKSCSCNMRGFINNEKEDETYYSYNLLGTFVLHPVPLREYNLKQTANLYLESAYGNFAEQLFYLFGWEFLKKLNYTDETNQWVLQKLLQSDMKTKILSEFPSSVLQGQLSTLFTNAILPVIRQSYHQKELLAITRAEPFYIHAAESDLPDLNTIISTLCTNTKYHTLHHLPLLVALASKLAEDFLFGVRATNWNSGEINLILKTIVEIILPYGNTIYDDAIQSIDPILVRLKPFFSEKMAQLAHNMDTAIQCFNHGEINYDALTHAWGSQLSTCNLILSLIPDLSQATSYPHTIYHLHARVLQKKSALCIANSESLPLESMLSTMTSDTSTQKRILQETLIDPSSKTALIDSILNYTTSAFSSESLLHHPFGNTKSVLFHAFTTKNEVLSQVLLSKRTNDDDLMEIIEATLSENQIEDNTTPIREGGFFPLLPLRRPDRDSEEETNNRSPSNS